MQERVVEYWLTSATERTYEAPFAQLLSLEGSRVLQGPVHHPFEHGKDILALDSANNLCAYQLKTGDIDVREFEKIHGQLLALVSTAISYPGISPARLPDKTFLVTNGSLTAPARDRLAAFNVGSKQKGNCEIALIERENLVGRFSRCHSDLVPSSVEDLERLLQFLLADGRGTYEAEDMLQLTIGTLTLAAEAKTAPQIKRALGSMVLLTAYSTRSWHVANNDLGVSQAWIAAAVGILAAAEKLALPQELWSDAFSLASTMAQRALDAMIREAADLPDLVIADMTEGMAYPARALLVCAWAAAFLLSEAVLGRADQHIEPVRKILLREVDYVQVPGEVAAPYLHVIAKALEFLDEKKRAETLQQGWLLTLLKAQEQSATHPFPSPYFGLEESLAMQLGGVSDSKQGLFNGHTYTGWQAIDWFARRDQRSLLEPIWPGLSRLTYINVRVEEAWQLLAGKSDQANMVVWDPPLPTSWRNLRCDEESLAMDNVPRTLASHVEIAPFVGLVLPYRFNRALAKLLDTSIISHSQ